MTGVLKIGGNWTHIEGQQCQDSGRIPSTSQEMPEAPQR